ncbi:MAG TPA: SH3 domain-containing protein, partial [Dissulfurispiraceae bacterium]
MKDKVRKGLAFLVPFLFLEALLCREARADYHIRQNIPQSVRYIRENQQYIIKAAYFITGVEEAKTIGNGTLEQKANGKFVVVKFKVSSKSAVSVVTSNILLDLILIDGKKNRWEQALNATASLRIDLAKYRKSGNLGSPGNGELEDVAVFDIPEEVKDYFILLPGGAKIVTAPSHSSPGAAKAEGPDSAKTEEKRTAVVAENAVHLRLKPSLDEPPVTWSVKGTAFEVLEEFKEANGRKWYKVKAANGKDYWVVGKVVKIHGGQKKAEDQRKEAEAKPEPAKAAGTEASAGRVTVAVIPNAANLRAQPSHDSEPLTWIKKGVVLEVLDKAVDSFGKRWYKVRKHDGVTGWVRDIVVTRPETESREAENKEQPLKTKAAEPEAKTEVAKPEVKFEAARPEAKTEEVN